MKRITHSHFGSNFQSDSDRTVSECFPNTCQSAVMMMHFLSLSVMLVLTSGCDFKDVECVDEKQVLFQLRSDVRDLTEYLDSHQGLGAVAQDPRSRRWRRHDRRYHPYGPPSTSASASTTSTSTTTSSTSSTSSSTSSTTSTSTVTIPSCIAIGLQFEADNSTNPALPASENTTVLLEFQGPTAGCCVGSQVSVTAQINAVGETSGILAVFLETPTGQSELLGSVDDGLGFGFSSSSGIVFPGEVIAGVWKLIFLGSVDAANYVLSSSLLSIVSGQCV